MTRFVAAGEVPVSAEGGIYASAPTLSTQVENFFENSSHHLECTDFIFEINPCANIPIPRPILDFLPEQHRSPKHLKFRTA